MIEPTTLLAFVPVEGLNRDDEPTKFAGAYSPYMKNAVVELTKVRKRRGYTQLGTNLPLSGVGMELISYLDARGSTHMIALTTTKAYLYDTSLNTWGEITPMSAEFSGGPNNRWSWCPATDTKEFPNNGGTALLISNGVDDVHQYEGDTGDRFTTLAHLFDSFGNTKELAEFWNHVFFINYNNGANNVRSLAYADAGNVDAWIAGTSGAHMLTDSRGALLRAKKLGADMVLYSERSITMCRYYGGPSIFSFPTLVYETGLLAPKCIWDFVNVHFLLGTDQKVYAYYGGTQMLPIGERVEESLFAELDVSKKQHVVTGLDQGKHVVHFFVPRASDDYAKVSYAINYKRRNMPWEYHEFADTVRDFSMFQNSFTWYCDDDDRKDLYCDEVGFYCDDSYGQIGYEMAVFLSHDGYVFKLDELAGKDDNADIEFEVQSPDVTLDDEKSKFRTVWISFTARSSVVDSTVYVYYSTDGGVSWTELVDSPVSLESKWKAHRLPVDTLARRIRAKVYQKSDKDVQLRGTFKFKVVPQPERD